MYKKKKSEQQYLKRLNGNSKVIDFYRKKKQRNGQVTRI